MPNLKCFYTLTTLEAMLCWHTNSVGSVPILNSRPVLSPSHHLFPCAFFTFLHCGTGQLYPPFPPSHFFTFFKILHLIAFLSCHSTKPLVNYAEAMPVLSLIQARISLSLCVLLQASVKAFCSFPSVFMFIIKVTQE